MNPQIAQYSRHLLILSLLLPAARALADDSVGALDQANVVWDSPSKNSAGSMPLGNGEIALNVWVEETGDLCFYIAKTDAWGDDVRGDFGLPKVGRIRVKLTPNPRKAGAFKQTLDLQRGQIVINEGPVEFVVWVDANSPVIHVEIKSDEARIMEARLEPYRTKPGNGLGADVTFAPAETRVAWCYRNKSKETPALVNLTFGGLMKGPNLGIGENTLSLISQPGNSHRVDVYVLTAQAATAENWLEQITQLAQKSDAARIGGAHKAHLDWWAKFWDRSYILLAGDDNARKVNQGYAQQRFVQACMGRGTYPIKFNGGLFTADMAFRRDNRDKNYPADKRDWGGQYWFQNTRAMYWPMLQAGDFEMMLPLFRMYKAQIIANEAKVKEYYAHEGSYIAETAPFWGGIQKIKPEDPGSWTNRYFTPVLELTMMMLDYYEYTGDAAFARDTIVPVARLGLTFFDKHFGRDAKGKILLDPDNSIEMYWKVRNPLPDIAGLHAVLPRLLALPDDLLDQPTREAWRKMVGELPDIPTGQRKGKLAILAMEDGQEEKTRNSENPELYSIYPFRLYGLNKPNLDLARYTFQIRKMKQKGCWVQDPIQAAMLGFTQDAQAYTLFDLTNKDPNMRFPAFWEHANDYMPDEDNGGNGLHGLQSMLMQSDGRKIMLLPAWPKDWNASFKLHAPLQTTVEGTVRAGKVEGLKVTPPERAKDVEVMSAK